MPALRRTRPRSSKQRGLTSHPDHRLVPLNPGAAICARPREMKMRIVAHAAARAIRFNSFAAISTIRRQGNEPRRLSIIAGMLQDDESA